jgi:hypothetical protein
VPPKGGVAPISAPSPTMPSRFVAQHPHLKWLRSRQSHPSRTDQILNKKPRVRTCRARNIGNCNCPKLSVVAVCPEGCSSTRAPINGSWFESVAWQVMVALRSCAVRCSGARTFSKSKGTNIGRKRLPMVRSPFQFAAKQQHIPERRFRTSFREV